MGDEPPCAKCRREHRDCRFDRRSRTSKHRDPPNWNRIRATEHATRPQPASTTQSRSPQDVDTLVQEDLSPAAPPSRVLTQELGTRWRRSSLHDSSLSGRVVSSFVTGSNDALDVLSDAANLLHHATVSPSSGPSSAQPTHPVQDVPFAVPAREQPGGQIGVGFIIQALSEPVDETLDMWDKCRFVRQGWFTSQEAVTYIDLFFKYLSPLSPVTVDQFRNHDAHSSLVHEESMLCCTILMISSRFFLLPGAGGISRSHLIHNRLWQFCELMIKRIILGQEKISSAKMRIIGTIESLLLISDWHPRAIHFPPDTEGWDALLIDLNYDRENRKRTNDEEPLLRWRKDVFEPAKRASRMSWMLLGLATNLAYELGILSTDQRANYSASSVAVCRKFRAQRLLYAYMTQTATRLGYSSVFPETVSIASSRSSMQDMGDSSQASWTSYIEVYLEFIRLSKVASSMFFQSVDHLEGLLRIDGYPDLLDHFLSSLFNWKASLDSKCKAGLLRTSLSIEYFHLRACVGAISIQAVVRRAATANLDGVEKDSLAGYMTTQDARFLQEVVSDSSEVLRIATQTSFQSHLAYAPASIRISVISASVFLLKALSLGSPATDVSTALRTLDRCVTALGRYPPDDMDFALRYAHLIEKHTQFLKFNHFSASEAHGRSAVQSYTPSYNHNNLSGFDISLPILPADQNVNDDMSSDQTGIWRALQFDSSIAPFSNNTDQLYQGFDIDSLNFLWNLPDNT
ncbi:hypothetical protein BDP55DRAFT_638112 [Colletotrichum godetiae]|uniref:Transcription factor domain-containing protein n=1 Tax=Colletotrichum godetiae TaxID=1209918 RepID=A0AAJ0AAL0_9PEZI|nr:uncharacterized protein BDP55DRAFT_638112 [Colletotrichum godetiae]KAK1658121.1 hypothetical protein BDP55DRAFT_638112 [Colletotrichum godetiae]